MGDRPKGMVETCSVQPLMSRAIVYPCSRATREANTILELCGDRSRLESTPVYRFMDLFVV